MFQESFKFDNGHLWISRLYTIILSKVCTATMSSVLLYSFRASGADFGFTDSVELGLLFNLETGEEVDVSEQHVVFLVKLEVYV